MSHTHTNLLYHIVFSTKNRNPFISPDIAPRLHEYLGGVVRGMGGIALIVNGTADHVHLLAKLRQDQSLADAMRTLKADSSGWVHRTFPDLASFAWQRGYGAFTVSFSQVEPVRLYIARQEEHHRKVTFQEEYIALLKKHEIEFDEKYLWE